MAVKMSPNILKISPLLTITFKHNILIQKTSLSQSFLSHYQLVILSTSSPFRKETYK